MPFFHPVHLFREVLGGEMRITLCNDGGFDVRWVRFPKHISLFSALSQLESVSLEDFPDWVQRVVRGLVLDTTVLVRRKMVVLLFHFTATASHPQLA